MVWADSVSGIVSKHFAMLKGIQGSIFMANCGLHSLQALELSSFFFIVFFGYCYAVKYVASSPPLYDFS